MAYVDERRRSKLPVAGVAIVHVAIGYALLSGLAGVVMHGDPWKPLIITSIPADPPPPLPHPTTRSKKPTPATPSMGTRPEKIDRTTTVTFDHLDVKQPTVIDLKPLPPIGLGRITDAGSAIGATPKGDKSDWIREEDYPSSALRAGDEGTVTIGVAIGANGRVSACTVTGSSGHGALDQATCRLYAARARYAPARDASGMAMATTLTDRVRWQIPR